MTHSLTIVCGARGCARPLTAKTAIVLRDGRTVCRRHADRMPPFLRRPAPPGRKDQPGNETDPAPKGSPPA